jgi:hypothetical protein
MFTLMCRQANIVATVLLPLSTTPGIIVDIVVDTGDKLSINYRQYCFYPKQFLLPVPWINENPGNGFITGVKGKCDNLIAGNNDPGDNLFTDTCEQFIALSLTPAINTKLWL